MTSSYSIDLILDKLNIDIQYEIIERIINNSEYDEEFLLHVLLYAIKNKNLNLIKFLFGNFNNIDVIKNNNNNPFIHAIYSEDLEIIKFFIESGFEILKQYNYIYNNQKFTSDAYHAAIERVNNSDSIFKYFFKIDKIINNIPLDKKQKYLNQEQPLLIWCIFNKNFNIFKFLIENGADINCKDLNTNDDCHSILLNRITSEKNKSNIKIYIKMLDYLKKINTTIIKKENLNECAICLEEYKIDDKIIILNCNHNFHENCIENLIPNENKNSLCPLCRKTID